MHLFDDPHAVPLIIPTVLIPFTMLSVGLSVVATFIAGLFGIKLKLEGPKRLLEVLMAPRILIGSTLVSLLGFGIYKVGINFKNRSAYLWSIKMHHQAIPSNSRYTNVYGDNLIYSSNSNLPAVVNGVQVVWETQISVDKGAFRGAIASGDSLFIGMGDGKIYELAQVDGKIKRTFTLGAFASSRPLIYNNKLYTGEGSHDTHKARIYEFDLSSGQLLRSYSTLGHTEGRPKLASWKGSDLIFAPAGNDGLHAIDLQTFQARWHVPTGHTDSGVTVHEGVVYMGTGREKEDLTHFAPKAMAFDFYSGKILFEHELPASSWMPPAIVGNTICYIMGEIYFPSQVGGLSCYDAKSGDQKFSFISDSPAIGTPIVIGNDIILSGLNGSLCRYSIDSQKQLWCFQGQSHNSMAPPTYDPQKNLIYFPLRNEGLSVINSINGTELYRYRPNDWQATHAGATLVNGDVVLADFTGRLRRLHFLDESMAKNNQQ